MIDNCRHFTFQSAVICSDVSEDVQLLMEQLLGVQQQMQQQIDNMQHEMAHERQQMQHEMQQMQHEIAAERQERRKIQQMEKMQQHKVRIIIIEEDSYCLNNLICITLGMSTFC